MHDWEDIEVPYLEDIIPEEYIFRIYPYIMPNAARAKAFIKQNAVSLTELTQSGFNISNEEFNGMHVDEKGNYYFESVLSITTNTLLESTSHTSVFGVDLNEEPIINAVSNWYYENQKSTIKAGEFQLSPVAFTIGKPFNRDEYSIGKQKVFIPTPVQEVKEGNKIDSYVLNSAGFYEFTLVNIITIEAMYQNAKVLFYIGKGGKWLTLDNKPGLEIEVDSTSLISSIKGKGKMDEMFTDVDLKVSQNLTPIKATPISTQDKVTMYVDWFDYDYAMPMYIAKEFITEKSITDMKSMVFNGSAFFDDSQIKLLTDMLALSISFAESFSQFPRITNASSSDYGKLDPTVTIGSKSMKLQALETKDPIKVIDGVYETYIRENPSQENSNQMRTIKQVIASLSRFIYSSYAIGKGQNSFNNIYLPWYLQPSTPLLLVPDGKNYHIDPDQTKLVLKSEWFNITADKGIIPKDNTKISDVRIIQTDRKITLPELPDVLSAINKLPLPGDVDTKTSNDLMYYFYLPLSAEDNKKILLESPDVVTDKTAVDINIKSTWGNYGQDLTELSEPQKEKMLIDATIIQEYVSRDKVAFKSLAASPEEETGTVRSWRKDWSNYRETSLVYNTVNLPLGIHPHPETTDLSLEDGKTIISIELGIKKELIIVTSAKWTWEARHNDGYLEIEYKLKRQRLVGVVTVSGSKTNVNANRPVVYDKTQWINLVRKLLTLSPTTTLKLVEENENTLSDVNEITIASLWANNFRINFKGISMEVPAFNKDDETIGVQRILFV